MLAKGLSMKLRSLGFIVGVGAAVIGIIAVLGRGTEQPPLPPDARADSVLIDKTGHSMTLFRSGEPLRTYAVSLERGGLEAKTREGDNRTPEGKYRIDGRNPRSAFHLSPHIGYTDALQGSLAKSCGHSPGNGTSEP
jgi:murein L,D-transpeptidase YafK